MPTQIPELSDIVQVACGGDHSLFLTAGGQVYGCGSSYYGQLGQGPRVRTPDPSKATHLRYGATTLSTYNLYEDYTVPILILGLASIIQVAAGSSHSLCLDAAGYVYVFGNNDYGFAFGFS